MGARNDLRKNLKIKPLFCLKIKNQLLMYKNSCSFFFYIYVEERLLSPLQFCLQLIPLKRVLYKFLLKPFPLVSKLLTLSLLNFNRTCISGQNKCTSNDFATFFNQSLFRAINVFLITLYR